MMEEGDSRVEGEAEMQKCVDFEGVLCLYHFPSLEYFICQACLNTGVHLALLRF